MRLLGPAAAGRGAGCRAPSPHSRCSGPARIVVRFDVRVTDAAGRPITDLAARTNSRSSRTAAPRPILLFQHIASRPACTRRRRFAPSRRKSRATAGAPAGPPLHPGLRSGAHRLRQRTDRAARGRSVHQEPGPSVRSDCRGRRPRARARAGIHRRSHPRDRGAREGSRGPAAQREERRRATSRFTRPTRSRPVTTRSSPTSWCGSPPT